MANATPTKTLNDSASLYSYALDTKSTKIVTFRRKSSDEYFTYQVKPLVDNGTFKGLWFVSSLDQDGKFLYIGTLAPKQNTICFKKGAKSKLDPKDKRVVAFSFCWFNMVVMPDPLTIKAFNSIACYEGSPGVFGEHSTKARIFYTCKKCKHTHVVQTKNGVVPKDSCPKCQKTLKGKKLTATFSTKGHVCNASCMYATGAVCVCGCGGANHGKGHMH